MYVSTGYVAGNVLDVSMHYSCLAPQATDAAMLQNHAVLGVSMSVRNKEPITYHIIIVRIKYIGREQNTKN